MESNQKESMKKIRRNSKTLLQDLIYRGVHGGDRDTPVPAQTGRDAKMIHSIASLIRAKSRLLLLESPDTVEIYKLDEPTARSFRAGKDDMYLPPIPTKASSLNSIKRALSQSCPYLYDKRRGSLSSVASQRTGNQTKKQSNLKTQKEAKKSNVAVTMTYLGQGHGGSRLGSTQDELKVLQQVNGGENICVFKGLVSPGEQFQFVSQRHRGYPFSATIYVNGLMVARISSCCEYRYAPGFQQGRKSCFRLTWLAGGVPCYRCTSLRNKYSSCQQLNNGTKEDFIFPLEQSPGRGTKPGNECFNFPLLPKAYSSSSGRNTESCPSSPLFIPAKPENKSVGRTRKQIKHWGSVGDASTDSEEPNVAGIKDMAKKKRHKGQSNQRKSKSKTTGSNKGEQGQDSKGSEVSQRSAEADKCEDQDFSTRHEEKLQTTSNGPAPQVEQQHQQQLQQQQRQQQQQQHHQNQKQQQQQQLQQQQRQQQQLQQQQQHQPQQQHRQQHQNQEQQQQQQHQQQQHQPQQQHQQHHHQQQPQQQQQRQHQQQQQQQHRKQKQQQQQLNKARKVLDSLQDEEALTKQNGEKQKDQGSNGKIRDGERLKDFHKECVEMSTELEQSPNKHKWFKANMLERYRLQKTLSSCPKPPGSDVELSTESDTVVQPDEEPEKEEDTASEDAGKEQDLQAQLDAMITVLKTSDEVEQLVLRNTDLTDDHLLNLAKALKSSPSEVTMLNLNLNLIGPYGSHILLDVLKVKPQVKGLHLFGNKLRDHGLLTLLNGIAELQEQTATTAAAIQQAMLFPSEQNIFLQQALANLPCGWSSFRVFALVELDIGGNGLGSEGVKLLASYMRHHSYLQYLGLAQTSGADLAAWKELFESLKENRSLNQIILDENNLGDPGVRLLADVLNVNMMLQQVDLDSNDISDVGGNDIMGALLCRTQFPLRHLSLKENYISTGLMNRIQEEVKPN